MAANDSGSPRQKMINLMYIVLMAMLALNVSSDVLNGFSLVDESLNRSTNNATLQNQTVYNEFETYLKKNPEKVQKWYDKAQYVKKISDSLFAYANDLKWRIVKRVDGEDADVRDISNKEDLEAATSIMLAPGTGQGKTLYNRINKYREDILNMLTDSVRKNHIASNLSTVVPQKETALGKNWQEYTFENTPVAAAVTLLTKLQDDIRYAEGEVLHTLMNNIDVGDLRVNKINAYIIPNSKNIVRGNRFSANIILAAVDSTQKPTIFIEGERLLEDKNGYYEKLCDKVGKHSLKGYIQLEQPNGNVLKREFSQEYTVVNPSATISATLMNVLYAGYDNPISVSVPGIPNHRININLAKGKGNIRRTAKGYIVRPKQVGEDLSINVVASTEGRSQSMGRYTFRVRKLPDPTPFIQYKDEKDVLQQYKGGTGLSKSILMNTSGIIAAIDDGLLKVDFKVLSFETVFFDNMGNAVTELSNGNLFSARQKTIFRRLSRGKRFYISHVQAIGPDGVKRLLPTTLEVIVN
jgi:gliding motility-associated protein GldM